MDNLEYISNVAELDEIINYNKNRSSSILNFSLDELDIKKPITQNNSQNIKSLKKNLTDTKNLTDKQDNNDYNFITPLDNLDNDKLDVLFKHNYDNLDTIDNIIDEKINKFNLNKNILEIKYEKYKRCHNFWNISTIVLSSMLTFIESCKLVFFEDIDENQNITDNTFILSPIILGTIITGCSSITKFKKYQENMERIYILIDKCISILSKLETIKDDILLIEKKCVNLKSTESKLSEKENRIDLTVEKINLINSIKVIHQKYKNDLNGDILTVYQETERFINFNDYHRYLNIINHNEYKKHVLTTDKKVFLKKYDEEFHENKMCNKNNKNNKNNDDYDFRLHNILKKSMKGKEKANLSCI